jgi:multiple sugar transport system permease protein
MSNREGTNIIGYDRRRRVGNFLESKYIVHLVLGISVFLVGMPIIWEILTSLKTNEAVYNLNYLPRNPTLDTYYQVLIESDYWKAIVNSFIISTSTTVVVVCLSVPAGYVFSRFRFKFDNLLFIGVIFARLFPPVGIIVPYYQIMSNFNLVDTLQGIVIAETYLWLPLMIYIMRNFFSSIPEGLEESARVDGCTKLQAFRKIVLPLALPGIAAVAILTFLYAWREFLFALVVSSTFSSRPISVAVYGFIGDVSTYWASLAAAAVLAIIPAAVIVALFQRYIVTGLTAGAMKG